MEPETNINPYAPPAATDASLPDVIPGEPLREDEINAYVRSNGRYYWRAWQRLRVRGGWLAGFNTAAFFLNIFWLLYRRMYREFFVAVSPALLLGVLGEIVTIPPDAERALDRALNFGIAAAVGTLGSGLYLRRAERAILAARGEPDQSKRLDMLRKQGGISWVWPMVALAVSVGLAVLAVAGMNQ
jgi:hypothetical protein